MYIINPTIVSFKASAVKFYEVASSLERFRAYFLLLKTLQLTTYNASVVVVSTAIVGLAPDQGCQMVYFHTKNQISGILGGPWKEILGIFYGQLEHFTAVWYIPIVVIWYIFPILLC
jgi:hypothetical protein